MPTIIVIRQESLREDAIQMESYLSSKIGINKEAAAAAATDGTFFPSESQHYVKPWQQHHQQQLHPNNVMNNRLQNRFPPAIRKNTAMGVGGSSRVAAVSASGTNPNNDDYGGLSKKQRQYICNCILWDELLIYQHLILHADNLNSKTREEAISRLWKEGCGYDDEHVEAVTQLSKGKTEDDAWKETLGETKPINHPSLCQFDG